MAKRSNFERVAKDYYRTFDPRAVAALAPHLARETIYAEPCAGDGVLIDQLAALGHHCALACDIEPLRDDIEQGDAMMLMHADLVGISYIITNTPWSRPILHQMIEHFASLRPSWMLFDSDWCQTKQSAPYMHLCRKIIPIGRVKWMEGTKMDGKDNCSWYLMDTNSSGPTEFVARAR